MKVETFENCLARANQLRQEGKWNEAIVAYQKAIKIKPDNSRVQAKLARAMMAQNNIQGAITLYQKAIALQPDLPAEIYSDLGNALKQNGQIDEALAAYQKAIELNPNFVPALNQLAEFYKSQEKFEKAISYYQCILRLQPQKAIIHANLAAIFMRQGNLQEAITAYQKAIHINPNRLQEYMVIDKISRELGNLEEANQYYYNLLKTTPQAWEEEYIFRLRVGHVKNGTLIPLANTGPKPPLQGGIKTNTNCPIYFYHLRYNFAPVTDINYLEQQNHQSSIKLHGTYLYAGFAYSHFGHYMAECPHRLWAFSKLSSQIKGVVILPESPKNTKGCRKLSPFVEQAMTYMQIPLESIHVISEVTEVEHLIVPEQASIFKNDLKISSSYLNFLSENEEKFFHYYKSQNSDYPEKLYVSRSHLIHKGGIAGEAYIEHLLQEHENFYIFKPESYSLHEQMNYYRHAKVCIFSEGSAIHGLELLGWLNNVSTVAIIFRRKYKNHFAPIIASRSQNLCQFKATRAIHPLRNGIGKGPDVTSAVSIFSNVDLLLQFFHNNDLAQLKKFKLNDFYRQEAIDILRYVMRVKLNSNCFNSDSDFLSYFSQFRNDIRKFSQNPYLKECL